MVIQVHELPEFSLFSDPLEDHGPHAKSPAPKFAASAVWAVKGEKAC